MDGKLGSFNSHHQKDTLAGCRKDINAAIDRICELSGKYYAYLLVLFLLQKDEIEL